MSQVFERRAFPRFQVARPCKVFHRNSQRYLAARTTDVSAYGALLRVDAPRPLQAGEELDVAVAWEEQPLLARESLMRATVVRLGPSMIADADRCQTVAVRFIAPVREAAYLAAVA